MKKLDVALTFNLRTSDDENEAELDTQANVDALSAAIEACGCSVEQVYVDRPVAALIEQLTSTTPDVVFNIAEGRVGRFREAFYPALFEQLGVAYTGSDAATLAITLDKSLTKRIVNAGARGAFVVDARDARAAIEALAMPVIVKPNSEGSSKGITQKSIATSRGEAIDVVTAALESYDAVLVEEYVAGVDVGVAWLESVGALSPAAYRYEPRAGAWPIYDLALKTTDTDRVVVEVPALLSAETMRGLVDETNRIMRTLGVRDVGRADWRVTSEGRAVFLEVNALPAMVPGVDFELYDAARIAGFADASAVVGSIIDGALNRSRLTSKRRAGAVSRALRSASRRCG